MQGSEVKKAVANYYDKLAYEAENMRIFDLDRNQLESQILLSRLKGIEGIFLDLGCGTGRISFVLRQLEGDSVGVDFSKQSVIKAQKLAKKGLLNSSFIIGEAESLPFRNSIFQLVLSIGMLEYVNKPNKILREIKRIIKKDGLVMLGCNNGLAPVNLLVSLKDAFKKESRGWKSFHHIPWRIALESERAGFKSRMLGYFALPPPTSNVLLRLCSSRLSLAVKKLPQVVIRLDLQLPKTSLSLFLGTTILLVCKPCDVRVK